MQYRQATEAELDALWDRNIADNPGDPRWNAWKTQYIEYNRLGLAVTFAALTGGEAVGEATLLLSSRCVAVAGRPALCNDLDVANVNALRIRRAYEGQGHISRLMDALERCAMQRHIRYLTIGVEARETRNLAIYLHWGFTEYLFSLEEDNELILFFRKELKQSFVSAPA